MILLDTHVALWLVTTPRQRLGAQALDAIGSEVRVCFSAVTTLEVAIKRMTGRLEVTPDFHVRMREQGLEDLPVTSAHAAAIEDFPQLTRHDPFDRLLIAQAHVERATFVTADRRLLDLGLDWILDARR